jgi:hypothetical protein
VVDWSVKPFMERVFLIAFWASFAAMKVSGSRLQTGLIAGRILIL